MIKISLTTVKKRLAKAGAAWCDNNECIIGILKSAPDPVLEFGVVKGILRVESDGVFGNRYNHYFFTNDGLEVRDALRATTCAFSGKRCAA